jgi:uncharacterized protein YigE (DUF2233 family)
MRKFNNRAMIKNNLVIGTLLILIYSQNGLAQEKDSLFLSYISEPSSINLYWKDSNGKIIGSIQNLKTYVEIGKKELKFAMNGGMYKKDQSPQGLYVQNNILLSPLDTLSGSGNFYLKPNGVFYLTKDNQASICQTKEFVDNGQIKFATQSGPILLINGTTNPAFKKGSKNLNIRNGVGVLPDNKVVFAMSKHEVNFYDFAEFFKKMNCKYALYLDGFISRAYLPEANWKQLDGHFGVMIGVVK